MKNETSWGWKIYALILILLTAGEMTAIVYPESFVYVYYHVLIAFNKNYAVFYHLAVFSAMVNVFYLIPVSLFAFRVRFIGQRFWQWLLILKLIADITGHAYEMAHIKSFWVTDPLLGILITIPVLVIVVPSYLAGFYYAFRQSQIFGSKN